MVMYFTESDKDQCFAIFSALCQRPIMIILNPLPDDRILDWSKLKHCRRHFKVHFKWKISTI